MAYGIYNQAPCCHPPPNPFMGTAGHGPPTLAADPGDTYINVDNNDFYVNVDGLPGGWVLVPTGGGGGSTELFITNGDPNGVITATRPAQAYDPVTLGLWVKINGGTNNTGWSPVISP